MTSILRFLLGRPRDLRDTQLVHSMSLIAFFAWVGLGADGLSSACYGPEDGFLALGGHTFLLLPLAVLVVLTVAVISAGYIKVIQRFPAGGGGYIVATRLLGTTAGLVSGCALVVDYVLTIAISIASAIEQILSFLPPEVGSWKILIALTALAALTLLNLRGVKESILVLLPIFVLFLITHAVMIVAVLIIHGGQLGPELNRLPQQAGEQIQVVGITGLIFMLLRAYTFGGGTFTGIEAVSNSMQIMREPKVQTGRRTMIYMAISLSITAAGILIGYFLVQAKPEEGKTLNAVLFSQVTSGWPAGSALVMLTLLAEGALLFVAAQAGFVDGPRVLATMSHDRWVPARLAHLSDRLVVGYGVVLMGLGAFVFLLVTGAEVKRLVVLYSITVFITFVLTQLGMCVHWVKEMKRRNRWVGGMTVNGLAFVMSAIILVLMIGFKFREGGWVTLLVTSALVIACVLIRLHYVRVARLLRDLDTRLLSIKLPEETRPVPAKDPNAPTAVLLVSGYNGLGVHSLLTLHRLYPYYYRNFVFVSVGQVDYDRFQEQGDVDRLREETHQSLLKYETFIRSLHGYFEVRAAVGTDVPTELEQTCLKIAREFPRAVFYGGQLMFARESPWTRLLHSYVTYDLQRRLHFAGIPMVILPTKV